MHSDDWLLFVLGLFLCSVGGFIVWHFFVALGVVFIFVGLMPKFAQHFKPTRKEIEDECR